MQLKEKKFDEVILGVDGIHEGSRVYVDVTVVDRGKGWSEKTQSYRCYTCSLGWSRGENREFGQKDHVHFNTLSSCTERLKEI